MAFLVTGCPSHSGTSLPRPVRAWTAPSITPIGQPETAGDTVVVYGTVDQDLYLYGLAANDGSIRWRQQATPSATTAGIPMTPAVIDGLVAYLRPDAKVHLAARLVVASPQTGADRLVSDVMTFRSQPSPCPDGRDVCVMTDEGTKADVSRRFSVEAGREVPDAGSPPPGSRRIGQDLLDLGQRQPEVLAGFEGGTVRWRSPLSSHFSPGYSTDYGWHFILYKSAGLHVGSIGRPRDGVDATTVVVDLSKTETAAIDAGNGSSAWRSEGTSFDCNGTIILDHIAADGRSEPWPVRCRYRGTARYDRATQAATYEGLDVTVEGFDVATGKTTWSLPLGAAGAFMDQEEHAIPVSDSEVLVQGTTGAVIIDLGTGSTRVPRKGEVFWCATNVFFDYRESRLLPDGTTSKSWRGGTLLNSCTADRAPTNAGPGHLTRSLGATVGRRTVLSTARGLVAYDQAAR